MGKTAAYVATAVLLGIVAMLPVIVFTPKRADLDQNTFAEYALSCPKRDVEGLLTQEAAGIVTVPSGPFQIGLIVAFSFVLALGVCLYSKKRMF
jgi:hypothetical protein